MPRLPELPVRAARLACAGAILLSALLLSHLAAAARPGLSLELGDGRIALAAAFGRASLSLVIAAD